MISYRDIAALILMTFCMLSFDVVLQIVANLVQSGRFLLGALAKIDEDN